MKLNLVLSLLGVICYSLSLCASGEDWGPRLETRVKETQVKAHKINWNKEVIYFLLVDRFNNGNPANDDPEQKGSHILFSEEKGNVEALKSYQGGDLRGIIEKMDYFQSLGITALWLSPIMKNTNQDFFGWWPYHGYHPVDHYAMEDHFGDLNELKKLVSEAHSRNIKVILDMVYNQVSPHHPWVREDDLWNNKGFNKWFHPHSGKDESSSITDWKNQKDLEDKELYGLPDFRQENPNVYAYLLDVSKYWIKETGCDGFRLDAVKHINGEFWNRINKDLHSFAGKDFLMLGEVFDGDPSYVARYQNMGFNALFDIPLYYTVREVFAAGNPVTLLSEQLVKNQNTYNKQLLWGYLLDNHDVIRFSYRAKKDVSEKLKMALGFIFTMNGMPVIYYGSEIALPGGPDRNEKWESTDYLNRRPMDWTKVERDLKDPQSIINFFKKIALIRQQNPSLYEGKMIELYKDLNVYVYAKVTKSELAIVAFNNSSSASETEVSLRYGLLSKATILQNLLDPQQRISLKKGKFKLPLGPYGVGIFVAKNQINKVPAKPQFTVAETKKITDDYVTIHFKYEPDQEGIKDVYFAGEFNGWKPTANRMNYNPDSKIWEIWYPLKKGQHRYKFVIDGKKWIPDRKAQILENDNFGGQNSLIEVK